MSKYSSLSREELEKRLEAAETLIELNKAAIADSMVRSFTRATAQLCNDINSFGELLLDTVKKLCDECPHKKDAPCETCELIKGGISNG